jgi:hypothetical protein
MSLSYSSSDHVSVLPSATRAFLALINGLAGYGTKLGNARVGDLMKRCDPDDEDIAERTVNYLADYVESKFYDHLKPSESESIAEDFFEAYPHWSIFFIMAKQLHEGCKLYLDEDALRMTSADWRVWVARMEETDDILATRNSGVRGQVDLAVTPAIELIGQNRRKKQPAPSIFAAGLAIGFALAGISLPWIAKIVPGLVQKPDYQMPVSGEGRSGK